VQWTALSAIERLLLPAECVLCQQLIREAGDPVICAVCRARWRAVCRPFCERCGQPGLRGVACPLCTSWPEGFVVARSAVWLDDGPRGAVHALKYDGFARLGAELGRVVARLSLPGCEGADAVVPIPLGARRRRIRGYNQCDGIAEVCAHAWGAAFERDLLQRSRETPTQTALTPEARRANVAGAFAMRAGAVVPSRVVLVDDVFTTGSTLSEAAAALLAGGVTRVGAATFGRAALPNFLQE